MQQLINLTITPTRSELSGANVEITANDGNGGTKTDQFKIIVNPSIIQQLVKLNHFW